MHVYQGRCHRGAIGFELRTARTPARWSVRACQCNFCRSHDARASSDAEASVRFIIADASRLNRYRFASKSANFYVCRNCGVHVASVIDSPRGRFATQAARLTCTGRLLPFLRTNHEKSRLVF